MESIELTQRQKGLFIENDIPKYLRHYTQLPCLMKILETGKLKLSDSDGFRDPKDKAWADHYKKLTKTKRVYMFCCTWETELIHHWYTYADGNFGCYLLFDASKLIESAKRLGMEHSPVRYIKNIPCEKIPESVPKEDILFSKAWAYRCEYEYRFVSNTVEYLSFDVKTVKQVTITAKMDDCTFGWFKEKIAKIYSGRISHSTLEKDLEIDDE